MVLLIDAYISPGATGFVYLGIGARTGYGLSTIGYLPDAFQRLNRHGIPWVALLVAFLVDCALFAPFPSWYAMVSIASSTIAIVLVMGGIGLTVLRRTAPDLRRLYRLPGAAVLAPAGTIAAVLFLYWASFSVLAPVVAAALIVLPAWSALYAPSRGWLDQRVGIVLGALFLVVWVLTQAWGGWILAPTTKPLSDHPPFVLYELAMVLEVGLFTVLCYLFAAPRGRREVWRSAWLEFLILGIFALSYVGAYGPLKSPLIRFPWDSILAAVLGLIVFFWGVASGFMTEEIAAINQSGTGIVEAAEGPSTVATGGN